MPSIVPPDPPLSDGVVTLRIFVEDDIPAVVRACSDPEVPRWTLVPEPYRVDDARGWFATHRAGRQEGTDAPMCIGEAGGGALLGAVGLHQIDWGHGTGEIGYWVAPWARRRGVATRAVRLLLGWALDDLGLERIELLTESGNVASERVAAAAGFSREGLLRSYRNMKGRRRDLTMWSRLRDDP